jgi:catalase
MTQPRLTTASGIPVADNQNSLSAGPRGPLLLQDFHLIEKLQHFNRERIPERVVHAKGSGAYGPSPSPTISATSARPGCSARSASRPRPSCAFHRRRRKRQRRHRARSTRLRPALLYRGRQLGPGRQQYACVLHQGPDQVPRLHPYPKRQPDSNLKSANMMFDFWSRAPESLHQVTILFSSRGTPDGYRHMDGFGSHTYSLINEAGERVYVKWHFKTRQGIRNLSAGDATGIAGTDPDHAQRDLFQAIASGDFPQWDVKVQVATPAQLADWEARTGWNPFDLTKVWPHGDFPLQPVGVLELNRNPVNYHAEVEQAAFSPANVVPGMGYSPDKMLQGRLFAYHDAQLYRVGTNHQHLPVNAPRCPFHNQQRDGAMALQWRRGTELRNDRRGRAWCDRHGPWRTRTAVVRQRRALRLARPGRRLHPARQPVPPDGGRRKAPAVREPGRTAQPGHRRDPGAPAGPVRPGRP